jgi:type II secretory pathway predicted ATPase ExeA
MDLAFWGLHERPFRTSILPPSATPLSGQIAARQQILQAFQEGERIAVLHGPHGVGKSLVAQQILASCEELGMTSAWAACVPHVGSQALLQMFLADLGLSFSLRTAIELRLQLIEHLLPLVQSGKSVVFVGDEAHHLAPETMEHLRPLVEIVSVQGTPVLHLLLVGTDHLIRQLEAPEVAGLAAWVGRTTPLTSLETSSAVAFLHEQWKQAGGQPDRQGSAEAWTMLAELGQGNPLLLQRLARAAFALAEQQQQAVLDAEAVWEAAHELHLLQSPAIEDDVTPALPLRSNFKESA